MEQIELSKQDLQELNIETVEDLKRFQRSVNAQRARDGKTRAKVATQHHLKPSVGVQLLTGQFKEEDNKSNPYN